MDCAREASVVQDEGHLREFPDQPGRLAELRGVDLQWGTQRGESTRLPSLLLVCSRLSPRAVGPHLAHLQHAGWISAMLLKTVAPPGLSAVRQSAHLQIEGEP